MNPQHQPSASRATFKWGFLPRWVRFCLGLALILAAALSSLLLFQLDASDGWVLVPSMIFILCGAGLLPMLAAGGLVSTMLAVLIMPTVIVGTLRESYQPRPWAPDPTPSGAAPLVEHASGLAIRFTGSMRSRGQNWAQHVDYVVAPVVAAGWQPGESVTAWVVVSGGSVGPGGQAPARWSLPGEFSPLSQHIPGRGEVEAHIRAQPGTTAGTIILGQWVTSRGAARQDLLRRILIIVGGGVLAWTLAILLARPRPRSAAAAPGSA